MKRNIFVRAALAVLLAAAMPATMAQAHLDPRRYDPARANVVRLPNVVGKVTKVIAGSFVPNAPWSLIVMSDKRVSLCSPTKARTFDCAPLIASAMMEGIDVSYSIVNGKGVLQLRADPASKRPAKGVARAQIMFLQRLAKASVVLDRHALRHQHDVPAPTGPVMSLLPNGGAGNGCTYDDEGGMSCDGGSSGNDHDSNGNGGGIYGGDPVPSGGAGNDYPSGNDNGDPAPSTGPSGDEEPSGGTGIPTPREPTPTGLPGGCIPVPGGIVCVEIKGPRPGTIPPVTESPYPYPYPSTGTWTPPKFNWNNLCEMYQMFCGWEPFRSDTSPDGRELTPHERQLKVCSVAAAARDGWCQVQKTMMGGSEEDYQRCLTDSTEKHLACIKQAGNGQNSGAPPKTQLPD